MPVNPAIFLIGDAAEDFLTFLVQLRVCSLEFFFITAYEFILFGIDKP